MLLHIFNNDWVLFSAYAYSLSHFVASVDLCTFTVYAYILTINTAQSVGIKRDTPAHHKTVLLDKNILVIRILRNDDS